MADRAQQKLERDAYEDAGNRVHPAVHAAQECYDRPEAYQSWIWPGDAGTSYIVYLLPNRDFCSPGEEHPDYYGDFMTYEIDAKTFKILKREVQEDVDLYPGLHRE